MQRTATAGAEQELAARLRLAVMRMARRLRQQSEEGATPSMLSALAVIERLGPITLSELAQAERVQPPSITKIAARLEEEGFIRRFGDPNDRRITRLGLSAKGKRFIEQNRSRKTAYLARGLGNLQPQQRAILSQAVEVLDHLLKETD